MNDEINALKKNQRTSYVSLFASTGTLLCCALPALLVTIGAGASLSSLISAVPQLVWISQYKAAVFIMAGLMLCFAGVMQYRARSLPCPADPELAAACSRARKVSVVIYILALLVYAIGLLFAFIIPALQG